jgi:hypothetical protein
MTAPTPGQPKRPVDVLLMLDMDTDTWPDDGLLSLEISSHLAVAGAHRGQCGWTVAGIEVLPQSARATVMAAVSEPAAPALPATWPERAAHMGALLMVVARTRAEVSRKSAEAFLGSGGTDGQRAQHAKRAAADAQLAYDAASSELAVYKMLLEAAIREEMTAHD